MTAKEPSTPESFSKTAGTASAFEDEAIENLDAVEDMDSVDARLRLRRWMGIERECSKAALWLRR